MEILKFIPSTNITFGIAILIFIVIIIDFFKTSQYERLLENSRLTVTRRLLNEVAAYFFLTLFVLVVFPKAHYFNVEYFFWLFFVTFLLCWLHIQFPFGKLQLFINRWWIKRFKLAKSYIIFISLIHFALIGMYYAVFIKSLAALIKSTYKLNHDMMFQIFADIYSQNKVLFYLFCFGVVVMYLILRIYMIPSVKIWSKLLWANYQVDIKFTNGTTLKNIYIKSSNNKFIVVGDDINFMEASKKYVINKEKIDYIEVTVRN